MGGRGGSPRDFFARFVAARGGVRDPRIAAAFAATRREIFAGPGPWQIRAGDGYLETPDDDPAHLYQDVVVALDAARGINIGEPSLHARCLDALAPRAGEEALHVGADTGCYTAVLARLVGPRGRMTALEIDPGFAARASRNLADLSWVRVEAASGAGRRLPDADAVCVSAGATHPDAA